jgi:hypothetical protein
MVGGVAVPAGAIVPARHVHANAVRAAKRRRRRQGFVISGGGGNSGGGGTFVNVLLAVGAGEAGRTGAGAGAAAFAAVITGRRAYR